MKLDRKLLPQTTWFLDYDGSLCPHVEVWEERTYNPNDILEVVEVLASKAEVFWNTGRRPESLGGVHADFLKQRGYFIQGSAFWEPGYSEAKMLAPLLKIDEFTELLKLADSFKFLRSEIKPTSVRLAAVKIEDMRELRKNMPRFESLTPPGYFWLLGYRGAELLPNGFSKATAIERSLAAGKIPVVVGDDVLDRPAAEEAIQRGGFAIVVGEHCGWITEVAHQSDQVLVFSDPFEVQAFIRDLCR